MRACVLLLISLALMAPSGVEPGHARDAGAKLAVPGRVNQTPWAASQGAFVAVAWGAALPGGGTDVYVAASRDSGRTFAPPVRVNDVEGEARLGGELPPRVALVARTGTDPDVVVAYGSKTAATAIKVARSTDGGRTFAPGRMLQAAGAAGDRGWHAVTLDRGGNAHVMWLDHRGMAGPRTHAHHEAAAIDGVAMAARSGLYYARDGAAPAAERELLTGVCYCCKVALVTSADGNLFAAWRHVYPGSIRDIAFTVSRDGGRTFAAPGRVSEDNWKLAGCPDDGPAMTADGAGAVHIVWPTVVGGPTPQGAVFYASSTDGARFSSRVAVPTLGSPRPMHPQILVDGTGRIFIAWDEVMSGIRQAAVRPLTFDDAGQPAFGQAIRLGTPGTSSSYPVLVGSPRGPLAVFVEGEAEARAIRVVEVLGS